MTVRMSRSRVSFRLNVPRSPQAHLAVVPTTSNLRLKLAAGIFFALMALRLPVTRSEDVAQPIEHTSKVGAEAPPETDTKTADISRKAKILNSPEWRRAVFELGHWLDSQNIYTATQVAAIKSRFNAKVAKMSSYEVQYLLDDLSEKLRVMDTPEARDARVWVGQYLSVLSENKRAEVLKNLPDVTSMSAAELAEEIQRIESQKAQLSRTQAAFAASRQEIVRSQQQSIMATQKAVASSNHSGGYSPYRGGATDGGKTPFSNIKTGGSVHVGVGPFGAYVSF